MNALPHYVPCCPILWQHGDEPLSEYAIATEALGRPSDLDAKLDATVRVQISRLRQRLEKYYEEEGLDRPERIIIPLGSHQIRLDSAPVTLVAPLATPLTTKKQRAVIYLASACVVLLLICAGLSAALMLRHNGGDQHLRVVTRCILQSP